MNSNDIVLLRHYVAERSEAAFGELVRRHIDLVYSAALRQVYGDGQHAEDATQAVFADLARKASRLTKHASLAGWLYTSTRYAAAGIRRAERRRSVREQEAHAMNQLLQPAGTEPDWDQIRPILDDAMHDLKADDREALLLRFFERLPLAEVGTRLGVSEGAARMRVDRATEKLRSRLALRGITSTAAALGTALAQEAVVTAPAALSAGVLSQALAAGAAAGTGAAGWLGAWSLAGKMALVGGALVLLAALGLLWKGKSAAPSPEARAGMGAADGNHAAGRTDTEPVASARANGSATAKPASRPGMELFFVDDKTGHPITNQVAWLRGWERGSDTVVEKTVPLADARCVVPFDPAAGPGLWVLTQVEGYADVTLSWVSIPGEAIPDFYVVRLVRPVLIHGRVLDSVGNPVAGAEVAFGNEHIPGADGKVESHEIFHVTTVTDATGRWQIDRIAPEVMRHVAGGASHPDYSPAERLDLSLQPEAAQELLDGTFAFHLAPGNLVQGTVVDPPGQPVSGALVHVGGLNATGSRDARSGPDGKFRVAGCPPGEALVTASAEGFAPAVLSIEIEPNLAPVTLELGAGQTLRVRVVDAHGSPIAHAHLWYRAFGPRPEGPLPQVQFSGDSDSEGRSVWEHAPDQDLQFDCSAEGFMQEGFLVLHADGKEHLITMTPALSVSGTVCDAESGEPIPRFQIRIGYPDPQFGGSVNTRWLGGSSLTLGEGKFHHAFKGAVVVGSTNPGYILRFEAEGYAPFVTRAFRADEGEVQFDVKLCKAEETAISIFTPAGRAAAFAEVAFLAPGSNLRLVAGAFTGLDVPGSPWLRTADAMGQFVLPTDQAVQTIAMVHPEGYVECTAADLRQARAARLQSWGSVEGVWLKDGKPVAQRQVSLRFSSRKARTLDLDFSLFKTMTDDAGHFAFPQVPPVLLDVLTWQSVSPARVVGSGSGARAVARGSRAASIQVQPGQTNEVTLNGEVEPRSGNRIGGDGAPGRRPSGATPQAE
jgi:RNA polymerase sigma factor (sigma-70 family)